MMYYCKKCNKNWNYPIKKCIFCGGNVNKIIDEEYKVIGYTQVNIASTGNEKIPYYIYLLEDKNRNKIIKKSFNIYNIGDFFLIFNEKKKVDLEIGIIGTGQLGSQIAEYFLRYNYQTIVKTRSEKKIKELEQSLKKNLSSDKTEAEVINCLINLTITIDFHSLKNCDLIIEAVKENIDIKKNIFKILSEICDKKTIFSTNTSSISINKIAEITDRPDRFIGMHFFNPVHKNDLVEVILGEKTSIESKNRIIEIVKNLNKKAIIIDNSPGFIVNRLLFTQINEAIHLLEEEKTTKENIDSAIKLGLKHPMGPFELADFIGLDVCLSILEVLYLELKNNNYRPAQLLYKMVEDKKLGHKTGEGFYKY